MRPLSLVWRTGLALLVLLAVLRGGTLALTGPWHGPSVLAPAKTYIWQVDDVRFGGMSALLIEDAGTGLIAGSDRGTIFEAQVTRTDTGDIANVQDVRGFQVRLANGNPTNRFQGDFESLTRMQDGRMALGFESFSRVMALEEPGGNLIPIHPWTRFRSYFGNTSFEALATLPDGRLLAITERRGRHGVTKAYVGEGRDWSGPHDVPLRGRYRITGADIGPDGCLYTIERDFALNGIRFRIQRHWQTGGLWDPEQDWHSEELYRSARGRDGNGEAISVWRDAAGALRITALTDDGFLPLPRTRLTEMTVNAGTCR